MNRRQRRAVSALAVILGATVMLAGESQQPDRHARTLERFPECAEPIAKARALDAEIAAARQARADSQTIQALITQRGEASEKILACTRQGMAERRQWRIDALATQSASTSGTGGEILTVLDDGSVRFWSATSRLVKTLKVDGAVRGAALSGDGSHVVLIDRRGKTHIVDPYSDTIIASPQVRAQPMPVLSNDGSRLLAATPETDLAIFDTQSGQVVQRLAMKESLRLMRLSPNGEIAYASVGQNEHLLWAIESNQPLRRWRTLGQKADAVFSPKGNSLFLGTTRDGITEVDVKTGRTIRQLSATDRQYLRKLAVLPDGATIVAGYADGRLAYWDVATGQVVAETTLGVPINGLSAAATAVFATPAQDGLRFWGPNGRPLGQMVTTIDGDWAVIDELGRYDASPSANLDRLNLLIRRQSASLSQLKESRWDPGLLSKLLGFSREPLRPVTANLNVGREPGVAVQLTGQRNATITVEDRGAGVGEVRVLVNGKEADAATISPGATPNELKVDLSRTSLRAGEENTIEVRAWDSANAISSRGQRVTWIDRGARPATRPRFFGIFVGVSNYTADLRLKFAASDAQSVADAVDASARQLFGDDRVNTTVLLDPRDERVVADAFRQFESASADDILFVYLAGHGVVEQDGDYAFLTASARSLDAPSPSSAIDSSELVDWIKRIPALKQVMVLDTCGAGAIQSELLSARGIPGAQVRAIERLQNRTGFHVLMGSAADRLSYEATQYGQGLLTHALLAGMRGPSLREGQFVDVSQWFQYAVDEVPQLARQLGGIQQPLVAAPRGTSFDVGRMTQETIANLRLPDARPLMVRPVFLDATTGVDHLDLTGHVRRRLMTRASSQPRGDNPPLPTVYVDVDSLPNSVRLSGTYEVAGGRTTVNVNLVREGERAGGFRIADAPIDSDQLALAIIREAQRALAQIP